MKEGTQPRQLTLTDKKGIYSTSYGIMFSNKIWGKGKVTMAFVFTSDHGWKLIFENPGHLPVFGK